MTKSLHSKNGPKKFPPDDDHAREAEIELIDKRVKLVIAEGIKKGGRIAGIILTSILLLLGLDKVSLQNRVGEAIHLALFGSRYEGGLEQTQSARSMLDVFLAQQENQYFEFLYGLRLDTWSDSDRALFKSLENVRADLTNAQQRFDPTAFAGRLARHGEYIDMLASYQSALLGNERERLFKEAWKKVKDIQDEDRPSTREKATVAMLKGLILRGHLINSVYRNDLQKEVDRLITFTTDLPIEQESGRLVLKARNVAALLRVAMTQAEFDSRGLDPKPDDYAAWVSGLLAAIDLFKQNFGKNIGVLDMKGASLNNSVHQKRLLLWMAGRVGWSMAQLEEYHYPDLREYKQEHGDLGDFNSYCEFVVRTRLAVDIKTAIEYWPSNTTFPVTQVEVQMLDRAFSKPGEFGHKTDRGDKDITMPMLNDIQRALEKTKDAGYVPIEELEKDEAYKWFDKNNFKFHDGLTLSQLVQKLFKSLRSG